MQTISAILSVLTALLTHLWRLDRWDISPWGLFCISADFLSQVMVLFYVLRDRVYSSLESGQKWHKYSNSSHKLSSACSLFCFWPSSDRRSIFSTGQDFKLNVGANTSFIQQKDPETGHEVGWKHFSCVNIPCGVGQETEAWRRQANTSYKQVMRSGWCARRVVRGFLQLWETRGREPCATGGRLVSSNALVYSRDLCAATEVSTLLVSLCPSPQGHEMPCLIGST